MERVAAGDSFFERYNMLDIIIDELREFPDCIMLNSIDEYAKKCESIIKHILSILPLMIASYSLPEMFDISGDAIYWPGQLQKMCDTVKLMDRFAIYDSFYNETYMNLCEYKDTIDARGIKIDGI